MIIYMLVPRGGAEWEDIRLFTTLEAAQAVMRTVERDWCFLVKFEGSEGELICQYN
jgi:hypothetical protein